MKNSKAGYTRIISDYFGVHYRTIYHWVHRETAKNNPIVMGIINDLEEAEKEAYQKVFEKWDEKFKLLGINKQNLLYRK